MLLLLLIMMMIALKSICVLISSPFLHQRSDDQTSSRSKTTFLRCSSICFTFSSGGLESGLCYLGKWETAKDRHY